MTTANPLRQLRAVHAPDGPWMANRQWAAGRIRDNSRFGLVLCWFFALLWNGVCWPLAASVLLQPPGHDAAQQWIVLIFPAIGLIPLALAIYLTLRYLKFGKSVLELETLPGCIGGWFAGTVHTSVTLREAESVRLALRCVRRVTRGSGKRRRTSENTLWEDEQMLVGRLPVIRDGGNAIPVAFRVPAGCDPTFDGHRDDVIWRLRVRAAMPGADYAADFVVPVFAAPQPDDFVPQAEPLAAKLRASRAARAAVAPLDDPRIDISVNAAGRKRLVFPASRNRGTGIALTIFALLFGGIGAGAGIAKAPILFPIVFGAIGLALAYAASIYWFRHVELFVDRHGIERRWRVLGFSGTRTIAAGDIIEIRKKVTAQANDTPYHSIFTVTPGGKEFSLVSNLRTADAAHVLEEIVNALGSASLARS